LTLSALTFSLLLNAIFPQSKKVITTLLAILVILSWGRLAYKTMKELKSQKTELLYPTRTMPFNNPYNIVPRGTTIEEGFKVK